MVIGSDVHKLWVLRADQTTTGQCITEPMAFSFRQALQATLYGLSSDECQLQSSTLCLHHQQVPAVLEQPPSILRVMRLQG